MVREEVTVARSAADFAALSPLTAGRRLHETRCRLPLADCTVEIDIFHGPHEGLVVAEMEFADEASCRAASAEAPRRMHATLPLCRRTIVTIAPALHAWGIWCPFFWMKFAFAEPQTGKLERTLSTPLP